MNAATLAHLQRFETVAETLAELFPDIVSTDDRDRRTPVTADAPAWDAIDDALDLLYSIDHGGQRTADEPAALFHWLTEGWRAVVLASHAATGSAIDAEDLAGMTAAELENQMVYLADYQG